MTVAIYDFPRVVPKTFDSSKVNLAKDPISGTKRHSIMYDYGNSKEKELHIAFPFEESSFTVLEAFVKETYKDKETDKYKSSFLLLDNNQEHLEMLKLFGKIAKVLTKGLEKEGDFVKFPIIEVSNGKRVYVGLVQSKTDIFTAFYNKERPLDILEYGPCVCRPALTLSINPNTGKVQIQIYQAYVHDKHYNFPLAFSE